MNNVEELGRHVPTVESVISRLSRYIDNIKNINVVIEWECGHIGVYGNKQDAGTVSLAALVLQDHATRVARGEFENDQE